MICKRHFLRHLKESIIQIHPSPDFLFMIVLVGVLGRMSTSSTLEKIVVVQPQEKFGEIAAFAAIPQRD